MYWLFVMHRVVGVQKDRAGLNDQEMSGLSLPVYYYCSPGDFMSDTAMYHPHVGLRGEWGTLVVNQPQKRVCDCTHAPSLLTPLICSTVFITWSYRQDSQVSSCTGSRFSLVMNICSFVVDVLNCFYRDTIHEHLVYLSCTRFIGNWDAHDQAGLVLPTIRPHPSLHDGGCTESWVHVPHPGQCHDFVRLWSW